MSEIKRGNLLLKSVPVILVIIISYLLLSSVLVEGFAQQPNSKGDISGMMGGNGDSDSMGGMMDDNHSQDGDEGQMMDNGGMDDMMNQTSGNDQNPPTGTSQNGVITGLVVLSVTLVAGGLVYLWLRKEKARTPVVNTDAQLVRRDELDIIKRVLSDDERAVLDEIGRAGEITQDSLRFRLEWSKSKLSRILTNMDKLNLIQRERVGKTYTVFLSGKRRKE
jgi:hypothetical protein